ncbi:hypothetical protein Mal64_34730 [Pseudobythopirellula maris]|uniref:Sulfotransferase family protein n=1 Tax=Pseudobythopirellula maris TaxID=2527991 RepID=A0A5C5ZH46_9BACT|nr:sulfotransferase [Pseudobythopirellula maris]TWT86644.1 hypothetical protein Mal64_34730 [Pseudobythopirellula maris]
MNDTITVVSGLPRSGTSLLMQMLAAGGMEVYTDGERAADDDNPRGYLELEAVKRLKHDASWLPAARGKAVKVISHLLGDLPDGEDYRVVFLERDIEEVLDSQQKMLERLGRPGAPRDVVRRAFAAHLAGFDRLTASREDMAVLRLPYAEIIATPKAAAERLAGFVGDASPAPLDAAAMAAAVDPALYRNRRG